MTEQVPSKELPAALPASIYDGELWVKAAGVQPVLAELRKVREDLRRTESAHVAVMAENRHYKQRLEEKAVHAPWLTTAHLLCTDASIPHGHINDRLLELRKMLEGRRAAQAPLAVPCKGKNCGSTDPRLHSADCFEEYERSSGATQPPSDDSAALIMGRGDGG